MFSPKKMVIITCPLVPGGLRAEGSVFRALPRFPWQEQASEDRGHTAKTLPWPVSPPGRKEALKVLTANHTWGLSCFCITLAVPGLRGEQAACGQSGSWRLKAGCPRSLTAF